ncbi:MAG: SufE family protein [Rickettsiales bacterium]|nr:SufE family protein [Rickettsiales bacterium]
MSIEAELVDDFSLFEDWEDRYRYIIDLGKKLDPLDAEFHTDDYKVDGCISQVWITSSYDAKSGLLSFKGDSDAFIVKGLIAVLFRLFNQRKPDEILAVNVAEIFGQIGLDDHLSPNRRNGFYSMIETIMSTARDAQTPQG